MKLFFLSPALQAAAVGRSAEAVCARLITEDGALRKARTMLLTLVIGEVLASVDVIPATVQAGVNVVGHRLLKEKGESALARSEAVEVALSCGKSCD